MKTWYHITRTWKSTELLVYPRKCDRPDTSALIDNLPCIHVCPTIPQCILAIGDWQCYGELRIYKTFYDNAIKALHTFDYSVTNEHRIFEPTTFYFEKSISVKSLIDARISTKRFWEIKNNERAIIVMKNILSQIESLMLD